MILRRTTFFIILFLLIVFPFFAIRLQWLLTAEKAIGEIEFIGHGDLGSSLGMTTYPVIRFVAGKDTAHVHGRFKNEMVPGQKISMRYQPDDLSDARIDNFENLWGDMIVYALAPFFIFVVLIVHRKVFPYRSRIRIGRGHPFIALVS
jgi:hypothetical protein